MATLGCRHRPAGRDPADEPLRGGDRHLRRHHHRPLLQSRPPFRIPSGRVVDVLEGSGSTFEIIAVSDGSTEASQQVVGKFEAHGVRLITMANNGGKGSALRAGMVDARGRYVGFIDADGDIPASTITRFIELTRTEDAPDIILGSKRHPDSEWCTRCSGTPTRGATSS